MSSVFKSVLMTVCELCFGVSCQWNEIFLQTSCRPQPLQTYKTYSHFLSSKAPPKPIALEPCSGGKAAVLTVLLCLPRGPSGFPPPGQSGMCWIKTLFQKTLKWFIIWSTLVGHWEPHYHACHHKMPSNVHVQSIFIHIKVHATSSQSLPHINAMNAYNYLVPS